MNKIDRVGALVGMVVGASLTWYAYHSNSHPQAPKINEIAYLLLFPSSICLMATENASRLGQVLVIAVAVFANGGFYALLAAILRVWLRAEWPSRSSGPRPK